MVDVGRFRLHYGIVGEGDQYLLAFHGYGQDLNAFAYFRDSLLRKYKVVLVDLFYHGKSTAKENKPITGAELYRIISCILKTEEIDRFSLAGYSLGGKVALKILEIMADKVDQVFLLAPDGLEVNRWYNIATNYRWANRLFRKYIVKPKGFFRLLKVVTNLRLISAGMSRFVSREMDRASKRLRVYKVWMLYRDINPELNEISNLVKMHRVRVDVLLGIYDRVISPGLIKKWNRTGVDTIHVHMLPCGHNMFKREVEACLQGSIKKGATSAPSKDFE